MPEIYPSLIIHRLNMDRDFKPLKQKRRMFNQERSEIIARQIDVLLKAKLIREVHYPPWLSNVVLVKKANGKWRMCIDFTDLNKTCPK